MFEAPESEYLVPFDNSFDISKASTTPQTNGHLHKGKHRRNTIKELNALQRILAAGDRRAVLLVFQAMDAAGKDSTIRAVMRGVDPSGCQVFSFKKPSSLELDHDFLWRTTVRLPERGRIGIFNRSQYEEVLVVRVHPEILTYQRLPGEINLDTVWDDRMTSICQQEEHLARNGTVILKFWLNVSKDEQKRRFLARLDDPTKNWKFDAGDVRERRHWDKYMLAYEAALNATSRPWAPWYAIPADNKSYMRARVAEIVVSALQGIGLKYPKVSDKDRAAFAEARKELESGDE
ncbi:MAG TPA: polyphosphate kinase 2 family protein [Woeseiaceae bacterium]|nr:polyphosphate kinase 2 family protein [Woeseiaceae bacterium]